MRVDAALRAGIGRRALIYVHTRLPIIFQTEARVTSALRGDKTTEQVKQACTPRFFFRKALYQNSILFTYLETNFKVFTELGAATEFAVQALVNEAVQLIGAVATVVLMVTEQRLINAVSIVAGVRCVIAFLFCYTKERNEKYKSRCQLVRGVYLQGI